MAGDNPFRIATKDRSWMHDGCIRCDLIDTWCKLHLLIWLYEHRGERLSNQELCQRLYQSDERAMNTTLVELTEVGFLVGVDDQFALSDDPDVMACVNQLYQTFADPVERQRLIDLLRQVEPGDRNRGHGS